MERARRLGMRNEGPGRPCGEALDVSVRRLTETRLPRSLGLKTLGDSPKEVVDHDGFLLTRRALSRSEP